MIFILAIYFLLTLPEELNSYFSMKPTKQLFQLTSAYKFQRSASIGFEQWDSFAGLQGCKVVGPMIPTSMNHFGDIPEFKPDDFDKDRKMLFNLNVGRAQEILRRELPYIFAKSNLDFSIFSNYITVSDGHSNKMVMPKNMYSTAVKSLNVAASFSSTYPIMNVKKIEYIEDCSSIQCLVDVVLPDMIRIEGQAIWEGMFYFGLDESGLICSHVFDRKISNLRPSLLTPSSTQFPWLRPKALWSTDLLAGVSGCISSSPDVSSSSFDMLSEDKLSDGDNIVFIME